MAHFPPPGGFATTCTLSPPQHSQTSLVLGGERSRRLGVLRGDGVHVVAKTTGWWKVRHGAVGFRLRRVARWSIETPETVPRVSGKRRDSDGLNEIVSGNAGTAVDRAGDDATHRSRAHDLNCIRGACRGPRRGRAERATRAHAQASRRVGTRSRFVALRARSDEARLPRCGCRSHQPHGPQSASTPGVECLPSRR